MKDYLKKILARILTSSFSGRMVEIVTQNRIKFNHISVDTGYSEIKRSVKACLFWGLYEKQEAKFIQKYLTKDLPVLEFGASIGVISCVIAKKVFPQRVYSVEANPSLIRVIKSNLKLNQLDNLQVLNYAIANGKAVYFHAGDDNTVGTVTETGSANAIAVSSFSLSHILEHLKIEKFNLVSDIEGSEIHFLVQDTDWVKACNCMIIELHDTLFEGKVITFGMLTERIEALGFSIVDRHGPVVVAKRV